MLLDEEYDGFSLKVDFNISKKEEVVASLEKVLENLQKDFQFKKIFIIIRRDFTNISAISGTINLQHSYL